jgi:hypothetical protein
MTPKPAECPTNSVYEPKFLNKVISIPVISSLKKQLFIYIPHMETLALHVGDKFNMAFNCTEHTHLQEALIRLDALAASGIEVLEKQVPIVSTPTEEVLRNTNVDHFLTFLTIYYTIAIDFMHKLMESYKGFFDPIPVLDRVESFLGTTPADKQPETTYERTTRIRSILIERVRQSTRSVHSGSL